MNYFDTKLTPELQDLAENLADISKEAGLDFFPTIFELVDYNQLNEIAAYGGFPTRYPHWRFGMEYEKLSKSYTYGLSIIYEMVINNNPCYAYLMRSNNMVDQKTVIAHVYGHCDFFKNNIWFSKTNRKMLDQMANHASSVQGFIEDIGHDPVEDFIDVCLSLENLIDVYAPFKNTDKELQHMEKGYRQAPPAKLPAKKYMDSYINPEDFMAGQKQAQEEEHQRKMTKFPVEPQRDILKFLAEHAPLSGWERKIIDIVRNEAYYFAPQGQTKILNEGWATYWHSLMMTKLAPLDASEIIDYCDHYAGIVASQPGQLNPYKLGVELLRHVERRWDRGQFGLDYVNCDDPKVRASWDKNLGLGKEKIFEVRKVHNDITFLEEFLDEDFCHQHKLFIYDYDKRRKQHVISSRNFKDVKAQLLGQMTNFGQPIISLVDANFKNRGELLLDHIHEGVDLDQGKANQTLKNLVHIWKRPVHIRTIIEQVPKLISFDGKDYSIDKVS